MLMLVLMLMLLFMFCVHDGVYAYVYFNAGGDVDADFLN